VLKLTLSNQTVAPMTNIKFEFNNNSFKLEATAHNVDVVPAGRSVGMTPTVGAMVSSSP
jgi:hypothetical protein